MATMQELEQALIKADAAGNTDDARVFASEIRRMRADAAQPAVQGELSSLITGQRPTRDVGVIEGTLAGVGRGVKDVIDTGAQLLSSGFDKLVGTQEGERVRAMNEQGKSEFKKDYGNSTAASLGRVGGNIAATWPVGGILGAGVRSLGAATGAGRLVEPLAQSLATGGLRVGQLAGAGGKAGTAASMATRAAGGAITGGTTAGFVDPERAKMGAVIGASVPLAIRGLYTAGTAAAKGILNSFAPSTESAARSVIRAAGAETPEQMAAVRAALSTSRPNLLGEELTVPQILQTPGLSQLQRTLRNAGDEALLARHTEQSAQRLGALNRISPVTGTTQQAAQRFGNDLEAFARPANERAKAAVSAAYDAVDPQSMTAFRLPLDDFQAARSQFLGRGTFGTGSRANQAIDAAHDMAVARGVDPATGAEVAVERLSPFREVQNLRSSMGEAAATAQANGAGKEFAALSKMMASIDDGLDKVAAGRGAADEVFPADVVAQWRKAHEMQAERLLRYETGPQRAMWRQGDDGQPVMQGGELAARFFNASRGQADDMAAFQRLRGQDFTADSLKNYAITDLASHMDRGGKLRAAQVGNWLDARSGAIPGLFDEGEQATLEAVRKSLDRAALAENLGRVTGSNNAQHAAGALDLGLLDNPVVDFLAGRIPILRNFSAPTLEALRKSARQAKVREIGGLLSDPAALDESITGLLSRPGGLGLLAAPERSGPLLGLSVRAAPLLSTSR
jgi:hypothetical protein